LSHSDLPPEQDLRKFGFWTGLFVVFSCMVGAGILTTSGFTLQATGNPYSLIGLWFVGGLMALAGAMTVAEIATRLPRVGGDYLFVREAFGQDAGFVAGWATFVVGFAAPTAVIALSSIDYVISPVRPWLMHSLPPLILKQISAIGATILILGMSYMHSRGHQQSAHVQLYATLMKILILVALASIGLIFGQGDWGHFEQGGWPETSEFNALTVGLIYVGYSYSGWNAAGYLAGEIRDPARMLPRCLIGGTLLVMLLYLGVNVAYVFALNPTEMMQLPPDKVERVAELSAIRLFGPTVGSTISFLFGLSLFASVSAYLLTGPRVAYAMARDGVFPRFAGQLHPVTHTPNAATYSLAFLSTFMVWSGTFQQLLDYASVGLALVSGLVVLSVYPLRNRPTTEPVYRMPFFPYPPLIYLGLIIWTVSYVLLSPATRLPALLSLLTLLIGIPLSRWIRPAREV
jgi:APA family basic amino acid/polyamine antiporter